MGDDRPITYEEDGKVVYRASSLGVSIRDLVASRLGITPMMPPDWLQEKFDQGNTNEPIIDKLYCEQASGPELRVRTYDQQETVEIPVGENVIIRGHIDGKAHFMDDRRRTATSRLVEYKAFSKAYLKKWQSEGWPGFPDYANQLTIYMSALGYKQADFVIGEKNDDGVVEKIHIFPIDEPPAKLAAIKAKIAKVEKIVATGNIPEDLTCDVDHYPCSYYFLNAEETKKRMQDIEDKDFDEAVDTYNNAHAEIKKLEETKKEMSKKIQAAFDARWMKGEKLRSKLWTVSDVVQQGKKYLSKDKLKAAGVDVDNDKFYDRGSEIRWPKITPTSQKALKEMEKAASSGQTEDKDTPST